MVHTVQIKTVQVLDSSDADNFDEVILMLQGDGGTPVRYPFMPGSALPGSVTDVITLDGSLDYNPPLYVTFEAALQISTYDKDNGAATGTEDFSGSCYILPGQEPGPLTMNNGKHGENWQLFKKPASVQITWDWA